MPDRIHVIISGPQGAGKSRLEALFVQAMSPECAANFDMQRDEPFEGELFVPTADFGEVGFTTVQTAPEEEVVPLPAGDPESPKGDYRAKRLSEIGDLGVPAYVQPRLPTIDHDRWIEKGRVLYDLEPNDAGMYAWISWSEGFANYDQQKLVDAWQSFKTPKVVDRLHLTEEGHQSTVEQMAEQIRQLCVEPTEGQMADAIRACAETFDNLVDQAEKMGIAISGTVPATGRFRLSEFKLSIFRPL